MSEFLRQQPTLTLRLAMQALQSALDKAEEERVRISVVVVDASGQPIHSAHMDMAPRPSREIALKKALTAVGFGIATQDWQTRQENYSEGVRQGLPLQRDSAVQRGQAFFSRLPSDRCHWCFRRLRSH
ncbi:GlcG/HbpS family heme-binding protein [Pseudomonas veronii]|uniref:GlcG/HbpS family heme-binding protein n=1 Tax=Pseudomonas veronii TaxID=76761 RepID=UPI0036F19A8E